MTHHMIYKTPASAMSPSQVGWRRNVVIRRGGGIKGAVAGNHKPLHRAVRCRQAPEGGWGLWGHAHTNEELVAAARAEIAKLQA